MPDSDRASRAKSPFSAIADNPFHVILGLGPRIQDKESLFLAGCQRSLKAAFMLLDPRFRKDDRRGGVAGGGFFHGRGCLAFPKSGISAAGSSLSQG